MRVAARKVVVLEMGVDVFDSTVGLAWGGELERVGQAPGAKVLGPPAVLAETQSNSQPEMGQQRGVVQTRRFAIL